MEKFLYISLGAIFGANARYFLGEWITRKLGISFAFGTLIINLTGSFVLGLFITFLTDRLMLDPRWRLLFAVGFLGAYTTFSTYTYESFVLMSRGEWVAAFSNLFGSTVLGIFAVGMGIYFAKTM